MFYMSNVICFKDKSYQSQRRDKLAIMVELLKLSDNPMRKTHLMYATRLNFTQLERYLKTLEQLEFIFNISKPFNGYLTTTKGDMFVSTLDTSSNTM